RLLAALDRGLDAPLVRLSGPAGYGKTTLLRQWLAARPWPAAWLTPDDRDDAAGLAALAALAVDGEGAALRWLEALPAMFAGRAEAATAAALPGVGVALFLAGRCHDVARVGRTLVRLGGRLGLPFARGWGHAL